MEKEFIDIRDLGTVCLINGQRWLHETEDAIYRYLVEKREYPLVLDDLFENPKKIAAIKYYNPTTIIMGSTGVYQSKINKVLSEFNKLKWLPKNVVFTMGEEYFGEFAKMGVVGYKVYPYNSSFKDSPKIRKLDSYEF